MADVTRRCSIGNRCGRIRLRLLGLILIAGLGNLAGEARADEPVTLWIEGETASAKGVSRHPWWYDKVNGSLLSGGQWISHFDEKKPGEVSIVAKVKSAGDYRIWLRANPTKVKLAWRLDDGEWADVDGESAVDVVNVAEDGKPDLRFLGWFDLGKKPLSAGTHRLGFRFASEAQNHGAIDCLCLTTGDFQPSGTLRPGQKRRGEVAVGTDRTWPFQPAAEEPGKTRLLDLRSLNETVAGEHGLIRLSADGNSFVRGDGQPIRWWATNTFHHGSDADLAKQAAFLARVGVNMIRIHGSISPKAKGSTLADVDRKELDSIRRTVAAMKKEGIYTTISPWWANGGHAGVLGSWGLEGYDDKQDVWGLIFFRDDLRAAYKGWLKELYAGDNPHGPKLKDEPAVALIQIQNEDSLFFWTLQGIKPAEKRRLAEKFGAWGAKEYGSAEKARAAWGDAGHELDDPAAGQLGVFDTWHLTQPATGGKGVRIRDTLRFLGGLQRDFYADIVRFLREEVGCRQLVNASNWKTADEEKLGDLERWTYAATDVIAVNRYYNGGPHEGPNHGWRIDPDDTFEGASALKRPEAIPVALKQPVGHPMLVTESTWVHPLGYQAEGPLVIAAYQSLTGVDGYYWFACDKPGWSVEPYFPWQTLAGGQKGLFKWGLPPAVVTQFPAAALMFRRGDLKEAAPALVEARPESSLWERRKPLLSEGRSFDPNRDRGVGADDRSESGSARGAVDSLAFLVGPVQVDFGKAAANRQLGDLGTWIDRANGVVRGATGEVTLDSKRGLLTISSPRCQGVTGFLKEAGGEFTLPDLVVRSPMRYAAITAISLDDKPLAESARVLVQIGAVHRPSGWITETGDFTSKGEGSFRGEKIVHTGRMPWQVEHSEGTLWLRNPGLTKGTLLDASGVGTESIRLEDFKGGKRFSLPKESFWIILAAS
jgi:hypothetical protein